MAAGGKFDYDKYVRGPEDYQDYFHADPVPDTFGLLARINQFLKNTLWQSKLQIPSLHQIFGMLDKLEAESTTDAGNIVHTNATSSTLLDPRKATNLQVITTQQISPTNHGRIDSNL